MKSYFKNIDTTVRPQDDFFKFSCGVWIKNNPIPPTKSKWGTFFILREDGLKKIKKVIEKNSKKKNIKNGSEEQLTRDFYRSGLNMNVRNKLGILPIQHLLDCIERITSPEEIVKFITQEHAKGFSLLWGTTVAQDDKNGEVHNTFLYQNGLTLPDRDFYLKKDNESIRIQKAFKKYILETLVLVNIPKKEASRNADSIFAFEKRLAKASMDKVDSRDIEKLYNKKTLPQLQKIAPSVDWRAFLDEVGLKKATEVVVTQPEYLKEASQMIESVPISIWKMYLRWQIIDGFGSLLSKDFINIRFEFYGKTLTGQKQSEPEWKRVIGVLENNIGEAIGKEYVKTYFPPEAKEKVNELVDHLFVAYKKRIQSNEWMTASTKKKALLKLKHMTRKLGYPDKWKSYSGLTIKPGTYVENVIRSIGFEKNKAFKKLDKKVDKKEWFTTPQTVNAFYDPNMNEIVFPAGILQPPFFDPNADDAINYGSIGAIIGHEITHGFDDSGAKFDHNGNFHNWWTKGDKKRFEEKTKPLVAQFNQFKIGNVKMDGKMTLGENIADLGGISIAYDAYKEHLKHTTGKIIQDFTPEQRFFLGVTIFECGHERPEVIRTLALVDSHSRPIFRVNGPMSNLPEFYEAFKLTKGDKLYRKPKDRVKIW
ncbi:M13 family metallopeptidase [Candidatus Kaiserbacteria bacterium]|nr:M13 family metallopeptidase [Candidatus Kaiserbacteria bacterium]